MRAGTRSKFLCHCYYVLCGMVGGGLLPPLVRSFEDAYGLSHTAMGVALGMGALAMALGALVGGAWYDRYGGRSVLSSTVAVSAVGALGIFFAPAAATFVPALMLFQFGNGLGAVANPIMGQLYGTERTRGINLLHGFRSVGSILAPVLVTAGIWATGEWRTSLVASASLFAALFFPVLIGLEEQTRVCDSPHGLAMLSKARGVLRDPPLLLGISGFIFVAACESAIIIWLPNFLESEAGFSKPQALTGLTFMMIGCTAIRFLRGTKRARVTPTLALSSLILLLGSFFLVTNSRHTYAMYALNFFLGISFGSYWPSLAAVIYDYGPRNRGTATGLFIVSSRLGEFLAVIVVGWLGDSFGLKHALLIGPASACVFVVIYLRFLFISRRESRSQPGA